MQYPAVLLICSLLVLVGCQTPPDVQQLQDENSNLQNQLAEAKKQNDTLTAEQTLLKQENAELDRVIAVLGQEALGIGRAGKSRVVVLLKIVEGLEGDAGPVRHVL